MPPAAPTFDPTGPIVPPARRGGRRRLAAAAAAGSLALVGVAGVVVGATDGAGPSGLRTAEVGTHEVVEELDLTGTVSPVAQGSVAFPTAGTVATVDVTVGDRVELGQRLATLDTGALDDAVVAATEALEVAQLSLEQALAGEEVTDPSSSSSSSGSPTGRQPMALGGPVLGAEVLPIDIAAAQQAVLEAATAATEALGAADASLALAVDVCAAVGQPDASPTAVEDCQAALAQVVTDQQEAAAALTARGEAADALDALLAERAAEEPPATEPPTVEQPAPSQPSTPATREEQPSAPSAPTEETAAPDAASAEELIAYQSDVDAAAAQLVVAQQALDQATIVSPLTGTVASVGIAVGDEVTAGSSTATVVVVGDGGYEIATTVAVDDLAELEVGQPATVSVDGVDDPITGSVVAIGLTSTEGDSGRVYPVTVGLSSSDDLRHGTLADLSIAIATSTDAVAVPASAIDMAGDRARVTVLDDSGETRSVPVVLGAVGGAYVEVSGVEVGTVVVIADLAEPLPETSSSSSDGSAGVDEVRGGPTGGGGAPTVILGPPPA